MIRISIEYHRGIALTSWRKFRHQQGRDLYQKINYGKGYYVIHACANAQHNNIQLLHTPSLNSVIYYYPRCGYIPRGRRPSGIFTPRVVINTLFNEKECAIVVLL